MTVAFGFFGYGAVASEKPKNLLWIEEALKPVSSVSLMLSRDDSENKAGSLELDIALDNLYHIFTNASFSDVVVDQETYKVGSTQLGLTSDPLADWYYSIESEYWGIKNSLNMGGLGFSLGLNGNSWNISGFYFRRRYRVFFKDDLAKSPLDLDSNKYGLSVAYYFPYGLWSRLSAYFFDYNGDVSKIDGQVGAQLFTPTTRSLSASLVESTNSVELGYSQGNLQTIVAVVHQKSAVDQVQTQTLALKMDWAWNSAWSTGLGFGRSETTGEDVFSRYMDLEITYAWK